MAKIHGASGALTDLLKVVGDERISSLAAVVEFSKNFEAEKAKIIADGRTNVEKQIADINVRHAQIFDAVSRLESKIATAIGQMIPLQRNAYLSCRDNEGRRGHQFCEEDK